MINDSFHPSRRFISTYEMAFVSSGRCEVFSTPCRSLVEIDRLLADWSRLSFHATIKLQHSDILLLRRTNNSIHWPEVELEKFDSIISFESSSMDVYWELSDFDIHTRQQGMEKLLQSLKTLSANEDHGKVMISIKNFPNLIFSIFRVYHPKLIILFHGWSKVLHPIVNVLESVMLQVWEQFVFHEFNHW